MLKFQKEGDTVVCPGGALFSQKIQSHLAEVMLMLFLFGAICEYSASPEDKVTGACSSPKVMNFTAQTLDDSIMGIQK